MIHPTQPRIPTQTLAEQWQQHLQTLPIDATDAQVRRAEREWYTQRVTELEKAPKTRENAELLREAAGWARLYIGRAA